jgi:septal ring factor EnvC (AmiA/AmiB activator)
MPQAPSFDQMCDEFRHFRQMVGKAMADTNESGIREQLEQITRGRDESFAKLLEAYPKAQATFAQRRAEAQQKIQATKENVARARAAVAEAEKAKAAAKEKEKAPKAPKAPAPVDPKLGSALRGELLNRYADHEGSDANVAAGHILEAWEGWDDTSMGPS